MMSTCCIVRWRRCGSGENIDWRRFNQTALGKHIPLPDYLRNRLITIAMVLHFPVIASIQILCAVRKMSGSSVCCGGCTTSLREAFYAPGELIIIISADGDKLQQTLMSSGVDSITMPLPISSEDDVWDNDRILTHFHDICALLAHKTYRQLQHCLYARCGGRIIVDTVALGTLSCCSLVYAQHHAAGVLNSIDPWCVSRTGRG